MKKAFLFLFLFTSFVGTAQKKLDQLLQQYNTRSVPYISVEGLRAIQIKEGTVLLDSREREEFEVSHLEDALFVGYNEFSVAEISEMLPHKDVPIVVYCSLGIRSEEIGEKLQKAGYTQVKNLYGGIFEWKNNAYPVLNKQEKETDSIHTFSKAWSKWLQKGIPVYTSKKNH